MITNKKLIIIIFDNKLKVSMTDKEKLQLAIGKRIKKIRDSKEIAQQDLAAACNFEKSNMARLEAGKTNPTLYTLNKIAKNLNISLSELVEISSD